MLGPERLKGEIRTLKYSAIIKLLQGTPIVSSLVYSDAMKACDQKIADLFGGEGSKVATSVDISIQHDRFLGWVTDRSDHLHKDGVFHLYTDDKGSAHKEVELYVPKGAVFIPSSRKREAKFKTKQMVPGTTTSLLTLKTQNSKVLR